MLCQKPVIDGPDMQRQHYYMQSVLRDVPQGPAAMRSVPEEDQNMY